MRGLPKNGAILYDVQFRAGTYFLPATVQFTNADSGAAGAQIVYENYNGETAIISGGVQISGWQNVSGNIWTVNLNPAQFANFEQLYVNGQRRFRARTTPNSYLRNVGPVFVAAQQTNCTVQVGAQWECFDRFQYTPGDINPNWTNLGGAYPTGDIEIYNFEKWTVPKLRLNHVDDTAHIAFLTGPTVQDATNHGFIAGHRYLVENVKDALTQPGQWFLDRSKNPWVLTYLAESGENVATAQIVAPQVLQLITANGLNNVTFRGLTFSHDNWVVPAAGVPSQQAEPTIPAALSFTNCSHITFDSATISHTAGWGVEFVADETATTNNDQVENSALYDIGTGGIRIGKWPTPNDTDANVPQFNTVSNTVVSGFGRVMPTGTGTAIWIGDSHDNLIAHNDVADGYNGGIGVCLPTNEQCKGGASSGGAFNNVVSFNDVYTIGQGVTDDMGCIYVATENATGNEVLNNRCHDVTHAVADPDGYGGNGIYIDSTTHNVLIQNNLVYRVSAAGFQNTIGPESISDIPNMVTNNIFAYTREAVANHPSGAASQVVYINFNKNITYADKGAVQRGLWYCYGVACDTVYVFNNNSYWAINGGFATNPDAFFVTDASGHVTNDYTFAQWQALGEDAGSQVANPLFKNATYPADDYTFQAGSPAHLVGFVAFDITQMGRNNPVLVAPASPAAFPLNLLNLATDY